MNRSGSRGQDVAWVLAGLTVLLEMAYPLAGGGTRTRLTVATVLVFFAASAVHAVVSAGPRAAVVLVGTPVAVGFLAEAVGVATGFPFGSYSYADSLGVKILGVPILIPLAWAMMAYPAYVVGQRLGGSAAARVTVTGVALASWDVFLDPQMVAAGHWRWSFPDPHLPGISDVPLTNFAGWLATALLLAALMGALAPRRVAYPVPADGPPLTLWLWTYYSSVLANAAFFGRPAVAVAGGLAMGTVALPMTVARYRSGRVRRVAHAGAGT